MSNALEIFENLAGLAVALGLGVYLVVALLRADRS